MVSVDTNVLVRILTIDEPSQSAVAEEFIANGGWVSHLVLAETIWVLGSAYGRTRDQLAKAAEHLLSHVSLVVEQPEVVRDALDLFNSSLRVGFSDCLILEIARKAGHTPLGTFDKNLAKIDGTQKL